MKCRFCDTEIPEESLVCPKCGKEFLVIPDYNPLDDILEQEMKNQFCKDGQAETDIYATKLFENTLYTIIRPDEEADDLMHRRTAVISQEKKAKVRKRRPERLRRSKKRKTLFLLLLLIAAAMIFVFFSYRTQICIGTLFYKAGSYDVAMPFYERAEQIKPDAADSYIGQANIYLSKDQGEKAEEILLDAIETYGDMPEIYDALVTYYEKTGQPSKIRSLFEECENAAVRKQFADYLVDEPAFSVEAGTYDSIQILELTGEGTIYYTLDGSEVTQESEVYEGPIELAEGDWTVNAICVNEKGIESACVTQEYEIRLRAKSGPAVTPSTGQYAKEQWITINVPDGCKAYYTLDGSTPTDESEEYEGPVRMPYGSSTFSAVVINENGTRSSVTRRYYERIDE